MSEHKYLLEDALQDKYAKMLAHAAVAMAALARLYRDTVVDIAGGDLLDLLDQDNG